MRKRELDNNSVSVVAVVTLVISFFRALKGVAVGRWMRSDTALCVQYVCVCLTPKVTQKGKQAKVGSVCAACRNHGSLDCGFFSHSCVEMKACSHTCTCTYTKTHRSHIPDGFSRDERRKRRCERLGGFSQRLHP